MNTTEVAINDTLSKLRDQFREYVEINGELRDLANQYFWALQEISRLELETGLDDFTGCPELCKFRDDVSEIVDRALKQK